MPRNAVPGFAGRLKKLREAAGLSQQQLADSARTHPDSVVKLEGGTRQPSLELAWRLARALGVTVAELLPALPALPAKKNRKPAE